MNLRIRIEFALGLIVVIGGYLAMLRGCAG